MSDEYPKVIEVDGVTITAKDAEEEARWRAKPEPTPDVAPEIVASVSDEPEPKSVQADPLDDVTVEMDNPVYNEPPKKKTSAKKK